MFKLKMNHLNKIWAHFAFEQLGQAPVSQSAGSPLLFMELMLLWNLFVPISTDGAFPDVPAVSPTGTFDCKYMRNRFHGLRFGPTDQIF